MLQTCIFSDEELFVGCGFGVVEYYLLDMGVWGVKVIWYLLYIDAQFLFFVYIGLATLMIFLIL